VPDTLNPVPLGVAELMVSGAVPEEVRVTDWGADCVFTVTSPKLRLDVLIVSPGAFCSGANTPRLIPKVWVAPPAEAVSVAVCAVVTAVMAAVNPALVAPGDTVTVAGTRTAL